MTLYAFTKTMIRELTPEEKTKVIAYFREHRKLKTNELVEIFEKEFETPVTETCIMRLMIESALQEGS